jgi:hypothetical protein
MIAVMLDCSCRVAVVALPMFTVVERLQLQAMQKSDIIMTSIIILLMLRPADTYNSKC